jgi:hypothetical protein
MDANNRIAVRLERLYSLFGAGDLVDSVVSAGGHDYREDLRRAIYRFLNTHLKNDSRPVDDSEVDLVTGRGDAVDHPIAPEELRVFATDADLPKDEINTTVDEHFVPLARLPLPREGEFDGWKKSILNEMARVSFRDLPWNPATVLAPWTEVLALDIEPGIAIAMRALRPGRGRPLLVIAGDAESGGHEWLSETEDESVYLLSPRGTGETRWTRRDPPNYVARSLVLLGRTVDGGRVRDVAAAARYLKATLGAPVHVAGKGAAGVIAAYAGLFEPAIERVTVIRPPVSHMEPDAPQFLNVLRICDIPDALGCLAPKALTLKDAPRDVSTRVAAIYAAAGATAALRVE